MISNLMSYTHFIKVVSLLMNLDFVIKIDKKSSVLAIYRDLISRLIGSINRYKISDFLAILRTWVSLSYTRCATFSTLQIFIFHVQILKY